MSRASGLYRLQQVDLAIDQAAGRLAALESALGESGPLQAAQAASTAAEVARTDASAMARSAEAALDDQRQRIEETDNKLYGGAIQNPKELQELQQESESLRRHLGTLEDRLLEAMVRLEQATEDADGRKAELERAEADRADQTKSLGAERKAVGSELDRLQVEREVAAAGVEAKDLQLYNKLRGSMGGLAVAELRDDSCGACGLTLGSSARQEVRSGAGAVRCKQCGRILYAG